MILRSLLFLFTFLILWASCLSAQTSDPASKTFNENGLKFNYPSDWKLTNKSTAEKQYLLLSKEKTTALIGIDSHRSQLAFFKQFRDLESETEKAYFKAVSDSLNTTYKQRVDREYLCLDLNGRTVTGVRLVGSYNNEPSKGEFYSFVLGGRLLTLSYLRTDKESAKTDLVWRELIKSLSLEDSNKEAGVSFFDPEVINEGNLNSRASFLKQPSYPQKALAEGVTGLVLIEIEINEKGELLSSKTISGHQTLVRSAEAALRKSKFKPTTGCDKPIRIRGIISYNFTQ